MAWYIHSCVPQQQQLRHANKKGQTIIQENRIKETWTRENSKEYNVNTDQTTKNDHKYSKYTKSDNAVITMDAYYSTKGTTVITDSSESPNFLTTWTQRVCKKLNGKNELTPPVSNWLQHQTCADLPMIFFDGCGRNQATTASNIYSHPICHLLCVLYI